MPVLPDHKSLIRQGEADSPGSFDLLYMDPPTFCQMQALQLCCTCSFAHICWTLQLPVGRPTLLHPPWHAGGNSAVAATWLEDVPQGPYAQNFVPVVGMSKVKPTAG